MEILFIFVDCCAMLFVFKSHFDNKYLIFDLKDGILEKQ